MTKAEQREFGNEFDRLASISLATAQRQSTIKEARFYEGQAQGFTRAANLIRLVTAT